MKKFLNLILCTAMAFAMAAPALADVAFTPRNDFFNEHMEKCEFIARNYYANGKDGYITVWDTPQAANVVSTIPNGTVLYITASYEGWGVVEYAVDDKGVYTSLWANGDTKTGWISMDELTLKYDNQSFTEEFGSTFTHEDKYQNALVGYTVKDTIYFYTYPGSGEIGGERTEIDRDYSELTFSDIYTDPDGRVWGYCGYYMQTRGWVCLDDPENGQLPATLDRMPDIVGVAKPEGTPEKPNNAVSGIDSTTVVIIIIAVAVIVIAVVIYAAKRKKKAGE